jgi:PIN domain nuclease of toxin-antitoxin system
VRLLLDTRALIWWVAGDASLSASARAGIESPDNEVFVSAVSVWEIAIKYAQGKLSSLAAIMPDLASVVGAQHFSALPMTLRHGQSAGALPGPHRDPFDRMLMAPAMLANLVFVSNEQPFDAYGVARLW